MLIVPSFHIGYVDSANRSLCNIASAEWVIVSPRNEFMDFGGIFLSHATNNITEYVVVITLMTRESTLGIRSLVVRLYSELIILQLT